MMMPTFKRGVLHGGEEETTVQAEPRLARDAQWEKKKTQKMVSKDPSGKHPK